jgi:hypothetical protein
VVGNGEAMKKFEVVSPDGRKFDVDAPDGATQEDAIKYVQAKFYSAKQPLEAPQAPVESSAK